jgi:hypothetical protein
MLQGVTGCYRVLQGVTGYYSRHKIYQLVGCCGHQLVTHRLGAKVIFSQFGATLRYSQALLLMTKRRKNFFFLGVPRLLTGTSVST